MKMSPCMPWSH